MLGVRMLVMMIWLDFYGFLLFKQCFCLTCVCLSLTYIGSNSRTERPRKTKIGTEVAHIIRDSDTTFKVKIQLVADVLNSQHAGTGATWRINANILSTCRGAEAYCVATHTACLVCYRVMWVIVLVYVLIILLCFYLLSVSYTCAK